MSWSPDWESEKIIVSIMDIDKNDDSFEVEVEVSVEGENLYRLYDIPHIADPLIAVFAGAQDVSGGLKFGDLVKGTLNADGEIETVEVIEKSKHIQPDDSIFENVKNRDILLDAIMEHGGFWALNEGSFLDIYLHPDFDIEQWKLDHKDKLTTGNNNLLEDEIKRSGTVHNFDEVQRKF